MLKFYYFPAFVLFCCFIAAADFASAQNPSVAAFADRLLAASETERTALLNENQSLQTAELRTALVARGDDLRTKSKFDDALTAFRTAQTVAEKLEDNDGIAETLGRQGAVYRFKGDYERAMQLLEPALGRYQRSGNNAGIGAVSNNIGAVHYFRGDYPQAEIVWRHSLAVRELTGIQKDINQSLNNLGAFYTATGRIDDALEIFKRIIVSSKVLKDEYPLAAALNNVGDVLSERGDYRQAMEFLLESLEINEKRGDKLDTSLVLNNIGQIYYSQGNYERAALYYERARKLREEVGDQQGLAVTLMHLGLVRAANDEFPAAIELVKQSLALREKIGDKRGIAIALNNLGRIELRAGRTGAALEFFRQSLAQYETSQYKDGIAQTLNNVARAELDLGNREAALTAAIRGVALARETGARETLWVGLSVLGKTQRALGQTEAAEKSLREAVEIVEKVRDTVTGDALDRQQFFQNKIQPYHELVEILVRDGKNFAALQFAERAKARVLLDVLQNGQTNAKNLSETEKAAETDLKSQVFILENELRRAAAQPNADRAALAAAQTKADKARSQLEQFTAQLYLAHPELKLIRGETKIIDAETLKRLLPDAKTALLEFAATEKSLFVFVVTIADGQPKIEVVNVAVERENLNKIVAAFREKLALRDIRFNADARQIYDLIYAPVAGKIAGKTRVIIAPDAALWELPFQALVNPQNKYVVESAAVSYAPSLSVLAEIKRKQRIQSGEQTLFAFGNPSHKSIKISTAKNPNPVLQSGEFADLPEAGRQVEALKNLFAGNRAKILTGAGASETEFKRSAQNYRILHFATHGILDDKSPLYSYVLLADDTKNNSEDGRLEAWELLQMKLNADLIVLSACETARGRISQGEGLVGLSWAFFVAGSPATVASQWKVESASTTELMLAFYRGIQNPKSVSKAENLRQSALTLLKTERYSHPFYWAGFVVVGDGD